MTTYRTYGKEVNILIELNRTSTITLTYRFSKKKVHFKLTRIKENDPLVGGGLFK